MTINVRLNTVGARMSLVAFDFALEAAKTRKRLLCSVALARRVGNLCFAHVESDLRHRH